MPLPTPHSDQSEKDFISACMSSDVIQNDFKTQKQRLAVCYSQWRRAKKKKSNATWDEVEAQIKKDGVIITDDEARIIFPGFSREEIEGKRDKSLSGGDTTPNQHGEDMDNLARTFGQK